MQSYCPVCDVVYTDLDEKQPGDVCGDRSNESLRIRHQPLDGPACTAILKSREA